MYVLFTIPTQNNKLHITNYIYALTTLKKSFNSTQWLDQFVDHT